MRSPFGHCVTAFLLTAALFGTVNERVMHRFLRRLRDEALAEEEYQRLQRYIEENGLDRQKVRDACYESDRSERTFLINCLAGAMICALTIIPYSVLLRLLRRFAGGLPDSQAASSRDPHPEELPE